MRPRSLILLLLALGCGLIASIGISEVMAKRNQSTAGEMTGIFIAVTDIPMGDVIKPEMVKVEDWPKAQVPPGALSSPSEMENRRPKTRIFAGSPILENQLLNKGSSEGGAAEAITPKYRVVAVNINPGSGVGSLIRPADHVDVLVYITTNNRESTETVARTVLQNIKVFAVDGIFAVDAPSEKACSPKTISLEVTPDQAELVTLAEQLGPIKLVLRSPEDTSQSKLGGKKPYELLGGTAWDAGKAMPPQTGMKSWLESQKAKPAPSTPERAKKETESFTVRVVYPDKVSDLIMEMTGGSAEASAGGSPHWKLTAPSVTNMPRATVESPAAGSQPVGDEQPKNRDADPVKDKRKDKHREGQG
ncbi:MAG: Flp pilus assembly protein CpaB [Tepidisphaeraceae bacterium]